MHNISIRSLRKTFGSTVALDDVSLEFGNNKIYGLLGRNGAGKTTLLNLITNKLFSDTGEILLDGENIIENDNALGKIYFMTENKVYPQGMKIKNIYKWTKEFYPRFDEGYAKELFEKFSLDPNKKVKQLSTGYASIFKVIIALCCNASILLLDEPVLGLDANHRHLFYKELLSSYQKDPKIIIISTHLIEEAADVIEETVIINTGRIILKDSTENLISKGYAIAGKASSVEKYIKGKNVLEVDSLGGLKTAYILGKKDTEIPKDLECSPMPLQELFIHLTNSGGKS